VPEAAVSPPPPPPPPPMQMTRTTLAQLGFVQLPEPEVKI
jgi:hypothetical protein